MIFTLREGVSPALERRALERIDGLAQRRGGQFRHEFKPSEKASLIQRR